jgi:hypothetical protein
VDLRTVYKLVEVPVGLDMLLGCEELLYNVGFEVDVMTLGEIGKWGEWLRDVHGGVGCWCVLRWIRWIRSIGGCGGGDFRSLSCGGWWNGSDGFGRDGACRVVPGCSVSAF